MRRLALAAYTCRSDAGVVTFVHRAYNQNDDLVGSCRRVALIKKRSAGDKAAESDPRNAR